MHGKLYVDKFTGTPEEKKQKEQGAVALAQAFVDAVGPVAGSKDIVNAQVVSGPRVMWVPPNFGDVSKIPIIEFSHEGKLISEADAKEMYIAFTKEHKWVLIHDELYNFWFMNGEGA